ncbi:MAG: hypothetical protein EKK63_10130 [Acinetobacter sp.]|uniref:hypothetical protein n=1 Tax=Acinetobacter sp. TaxID=472 RepID=UPI000FAAB287|nr:hypothetical protein [Acinetobacter sp.]RUP39347.1 MAG: hypothetical protein EKK63_10130 [Acinetobacter sp.]
MKHHIHTNNAPVTGYENSFPPVIGEQVCEDLAQAIEHLERASIRLSLPSQFYKDIDDAVAFLIERYEAIKVE